MRTGASSAGKPADPPTPGGAPPASGPAPRHPPRGLARPVALGTAFLLLLVWASAGCWIEETENPELEGTATGPELQTRIRAMLDSSAAGWNRGDLDAFMSVYKQSSRTTYVGSGGLRRGHDAIRQRYAPRFRPDADRDSLRFENLRVRRVSDGTAVGVARWILHHGGEVTGSGPFTLVLERTDAGWKIVHDHSSSSDAGAGDERPREPE